MEADRIGVWVLSIELASTCTGIWYSSLLIERVKKVQKFKSASKFTVHTVQVPVPIIYDLKNICGNL